MGLIEKQFVVNNISPPLNMFLATQLVDEFYSMEQRFILRDWEPAELDGGQFCEILGRLLYHIDANNLNLAKPLEECIRYIQNDQVNHNIAPRHDAIHITRVIQTIYKFRSQRGAVHISPTYKPNHMDSKFLIEAVRWCMMETLRMFWQGDKEQVAKAIRELLQFDVPCIGRFEDIILVQRTGLPAEEEILVLLHYAGESGFTRTEIGRHSMSNAPAVTRAVQKLESPQYRQVILMHSGRYRLTDLGSKRVREELSDKLTLQ